MRWWRKKPPQVAKFKFHDACYARQRLHDEAQGVTITLECDLRAANHSGQIHHDPRFMVWWNPCAARDHN